MLYLHAIFTLSFLQCHVTKKLVIKVNVFSCTSVTMVYFSESINELAASNWSSFSRQQYFDSQGFFISVVFSVPILLNCMVLVVSC